MHIARFSTFDNDMCDFSTFLTAMAQLNENLIRAMVWDLKEIISVSVALSSWMGKIDCMSWRYPSKQSQAVDVLTIFNNLNGSAGEYYVNLLESIYDRLVLILNLLIKFVDNFPSNKVRVPRNVLRPQNLSLGGLLNVFWSRMQTLQTIVIDCMAKQREITETNVGLQEAGFNSTTNNISHNVVSRNCQTDVISLTSCENCHLNEELLRKLIVWTECHALDLCKESAVANHRQSNETVTQWQAMNVWAAVIEQDLNTLVASFKQAKEANVKSEKRILRGQDLIKELKIKCTEFRESLSLKENQLDQLNNKWIRVLREKEENYKTLEKKSQLTDELLEESKTKENCMQKTLQELQQKLETSAKEKNSLIAEFTDLRLNLQAENVELRGLVSRLNQQLSGKIAKVHGNPALDMSDQIRANKVCIEQLELENTRLAGTLEKLQAFRARNKQDKK